MSRTHYYDEVKAKARDLRALHGLKTPKVTLSDLRMIYRHYGIKIDYWDGSFKTVRGQYLNDEDGPCVMVAKKLPAEQRIFTLAHELKHHFFDRETSDVIVDKATMEIAAELFAVELIFPDEAFIEWFDRRGLGKNSCTGETIVRLKDETQTTLSYTSLAKRAEYLGFAEKGVLPKSGWHQIRDAVVGEPAYKRIQRFRKARQIQA